LNSIINLLDEQHLKGEQSFTKKDHVNVTKNRMLQNQNQNITNDTGNNFF